MKQWQQLQGVLPGLKATPSSSVSADVARLVNTVAPVVEVKAALQPWVDWSSSVVATWQAKTITAMVFVPFMLCCIWPWTQAIFERESPEHEAHNKGVAMGGKVMRTVFKLALSVLVLPVLNALVKVLDCTFLYGGLRLDVDQLQPCFVGVHIAFCIFSIISAFCLVILVLSARYGGEGLWDGDHIPKDVRNMPGLRVNPTVACLDELLKVMMACANSVFSAYPTLRGSLALVACLGIQGMQVHLDRSSQGVANVRWFAILRMVFVAYLIAVNAGALATSVTQSLAPLVAVTVCVFFLLGIPAVVVSC